MATVQHTTEVEVPVATAYWHWTQFESFPRFMSGVEHVSQLDETHMRWRVSVAGVEREFDAVILDKRKDDRIVWQSMDGIVHAGMVTFEPLDESRTRVNLVVDWQPQGLAENLADALDIDEAQVQEDLRHFKEMVESHAGSQVDAPGSGQ